MSTAALGHGSADWAKDGAPALILRPFLCLHDGVDTSPENRVGSAPAPTAEDPGSLQCPVLCSLVHSEPVVGQEAGFIHCSHLHDLPGEWLCRKWSPEGASEPPRGPFNPTYSGCHLSCTQGWRAGEFPALWLALQVWAAEGTVWTPGRNKEAPLSRGAQRFSECRAGLLPPAQPEVGTTRWLGL